MGPDHRLSGSHLSRSGSNAAAELQPADAAVRDLAGGVFGMAGDPRRDPRHHVGDAAPRAGLWGAGRGDGNRRGPGVSPDAAAGYALRQAQRDPDLFGAAGERFRSDLRAVVLRLEMAARRLADLHPGPGGRSSRTVRQYDG